VRDVRCDRRYNLLARGVSSGTKAPVDIGLVNRGAILGNEVIFGSVSANRRHYAAAVTALAPDKGWLAGLLTRRVAQADFAEAFTRREDDVKVGLEMKGH